MPIRKITSRDLYAINTICMDSFMEAVAPSLEQEGIDTFENVASVESLANRMEDDNTMLVFEEKGSVMGYAELKEGRHVAMLFVSPIAQNAGIGKKLIAELLTHAKSHEITVSASITSVAAYERFGFEKCGEIKQVAGLTFQPMNLHLSDMSSNTHKQTESESTNS